MRHGIVALALGLASGARAETALTISQWTGPKHPVAVGHAPFVEAPEQEGFEVQALEGGARLGAKPALGGPGHGIADMGMLAMTRFPAEFPAARLVAEMGLATPDNLSAMAAAIESNLLECAECLREDADPNPLRLGPDSTAPSAIISSTPIRSTADLAGRKMRVPGSLWSRWARSVGGTEVNAPSDEMFEGLDEGAPDIAIGASGAFRSHPAPGRGEAPHDAPPRPLSLAVADDAEPRLVGVALGPAARDDRGPRGAGLGRRDDRLHDDRWPR